MGFGTLSSSGYLPVVIEVMSLDQVYFNDILAVVLALLFSNSTKMDIILSNVFFQFLGGDMLRVITQDTMTVGEIEVLLRETNYNGFPVVVSEENLYLVGFCPRLVFYFYWDILRQLQ